MKKTFLQILQNLAVGVFVGISAFGILTYFFTGDEANAIPAGRSILLGVIAFGSMVLVVVLGGMIDREAARGAVGRNRKDKSDGPAGPG